MKLHIYLRCGGTKTYANVSDVHADGDWLTFNSDDGPVARECRVKLSDCAATTLEIEDTCPADNMLDNLRAS